MYLTDVNVLVYAHREDSRLHRPCMQWLKSQLNSSHPLAYSAVVLSGFLRIVTHGRVFDPPSPLEAAFDFVNTLKNHPNAVPVSPGPGHWEIFQEMCKKTQARGNLIPDAFLAALAIEQGCEWITTDRDYSRFPQLKWSNPFD